MIYVLRCRKLGETETCIEEISAPGYIEAVKILAKKWPPDSAGTPGIELVTFIGAYVGGKEVLA